MSKQLICLPRLAMGLSYCNTNAAATAPKSIPAGRPENIGARSCTLASTFAARYRSVGPGTDI